MVRATARALLRPCDSRLRRTSGFQPRQACCKSDTFGATPGGRYRYFGDTCHVLLDTACRATPGLSRKADDRSYTEVTMTAVPLPALDQLAAFAATRPSVVVLAQTDLNTSGIREWILNNLLPLLLLTVALLLLWLGGGKGDNAGVMRRVGGVFVALAIIGLAVSGTGVDIGTFIAGLFSTSSG